MPKQPMTMGRKRRTPYVDPFLEREAYRPKPVPLPDGGTRLPTKEELVEQYLDARIAHPASRVGQFGIDGGKATRFADRTTELFEAAYAGLPIRRGERGWPIRQKPVTADFSRFDFAEDPLPPPEDLVAPARSPSPPQPPGPPARTTGPEPRPDFGRGPLPRKYPGEWPLDRQSGGALLAQAEDDPGAAEEDDPFLETLGGGSAPGEPAAAQGPGQGIGWPPRPVPRPDASGWRGPPPPLPPEHPGYPGYTGATASTVFVSIPVYRANVPAVTGYWDTLGQLLVSEGEAIGPAVQRSILEFFAAEGGFSRDGATFGGITQETLDSVRRLSGERAWTAALNGIPSSPSGLSPTQWLTVLHGYHAKELDDPFTLWRAGRNDREQAQGLGLLQRVQNLDAAAALFDVFLTHSPRTRIPVIERAVNQLRAPDAQLDLGRRMTPELFDAYVELANDPDTVGPLLRALGEERIAAIAEERGMRAYADAWRDRFLHFMFLR